MEFAQEEDVRKECSGERQLMRSEVAGYLHGSDFYRGLSDEDNEVISIPASCYKENDSINTLQDLNDYLSTIRFWGVDSISMHLIDYIMKEEDVSRLKKVIEKFSAEIPHLNTFIKARELPAHHNKIYFANKHDCMELLQYFNVKPPRDLKSQYEHCAHAAYYGSLRCLKYLSGIGFEWNENTCKEAAKRNHLDCLRYALENKCPVNSLTCSEAAREGSLECLKYAHEKKVRMTVDVTLNAAKGGHLECLRYAVEQGCVLSPAACEQAAYGGHLDCLIYAHAQGCVWDIATCYAAADGGHLDVLMHLH